MPKSTLTDKGYHFFKTVSNKLDGDNSASTSFFQKEASNEYSEIPICDFNKNILISIEVNTYGDNPPVYSLKIVQKANSSWCDLSIYSISEKEFNLIGLQEFERRLLSMWKNFYDNSYYKTVS